MDLKEKLSLLPNKAGCYMMKDYQGTVIYIGKAKNLRNRVRSYFIGAHNEKTTLLVSEIRDFSYILTNSEQESLILEINLIKRYLPKYNIRLVDDKSYPYITFTNDEYPRLIVERSTSPSAKAFGPYPNGYSARMTVDLLNKIYPFRKCRKIPKEACLYYHIGQCLGPCVNEVDKNQYDKMIKEVSRFLKGDTKKVLQSLSRKMHDASENLEFEKANEYKLMINHIQTTSEKQIISLADFKDRDILAYYHDEEKVAIQILLMRNGQITDVHQTIFSYVSNPYESTLNYLDQIYLNQIYVDELLFSNQFKVEDLIMRYGNKASIPQIGDKKKMVDLAYENAKENLVNYSLLHEHQLDKNLKLDQALYQLFKKEINHIEAFDNSGLFGTAMVSALIVYKNHEFINSEYRKFNLKTTTQDDYESFKEVVYRRYYRLLIDDLRLPDLILVDGGKGQVNAARTVIQSLELDILVAGMKKNSKHELESIIFDDKEIVLEKNSDIYKMIAKINNEIHRYVITFHRQVRLRETFKSPLDGIRGLGPKRKALLLKEFETIEAIKNAEIDDFIKIGINEKLAIKIKEEIK